MTDVNAGWRTKTSTEPIYEQLLREADEGIRRSVLAGQSSQPGTPHRPPSAQQSWTDTSYSSHLPHRGY